MKNGNENGNGISDIGEDASEENDNDSGWYDSFMIIIIWPFFLWRNLLKLSVYGKFFLIIRKHSDIINTNPITFSPEIKF